MSTRSGQQAAASAGGHGIGGRSALVYAALGLWVGGIGGFASLEVPLIGLGLSVAAGALLVLLGRQARWVTLGAFLLGMGAVAAMMLVSAITNSDPAVTYAPSTIPAYFVSLAIAGIGALVLAIAAMRALRNHP